VNELGLQRPELERDGLAGLIHVLSSREVYSSTLRCHIDRRERCAATDRKRDARGCVLDVVVAGNVGGTGPGGALVHWKPQDKIARCCNGHAYGVIWPSKRGLIREWRRWDGRPRSWRPSSFPSNPSPSVPSLELETATGTPDDQLRWVLYNVQ